MTKVLRYQLANAICGLSLKKDASTKKLAKSVAAYLLEEHRISELDSLLRDIQKSWAAVGYVDVLARVARPLPADVYQNLSRSFYTSYPEARSVNVTPVVDPSVIGGASLELAEQRLDISIAHRLGQFKKAINVKES